MAAMDDDAGVTAESVYLTRTIDRVEAMPSSPARTAAIRTLGAVISAANARMSKLREAEVLRLRAETELALAPLAEMVGMSKARAGQITKKAEDARG